MARSTQHDSKGRGLAWPVFGLIAGVFVLLGSLVGWVFGPGPAAQTGEYTEVNLIHGMGSGAMGRTLEKAHVVRWGPAFVIAVRLKGAEKYLKAGSYDVPSRASLFAVVDLIRSGKTVAKAITIPEGRTSAQVVKILNETSGLIGEVRVPPEGAILPETYDYTLGETRQAVLDRMIMARKLILDQLWANRSPNLPFKSQKDALTMASIVEKETGKVEERPRVAAVFVNRLKKHMRLQSDPTVLYGVSHGEPLGRGLMKTELQAVTPWNTYTNDGLPVTPIANPGKAALEATLNPAPTGDLYFVANGTGGHAFASDLESHNKNVANWRHIEALAKSHP